MKKIKPHIEWFIFLSGLILMGTMDPTIQSTSFCFFDLIGIEFCPGEGLGHSIAWIFRGEFKNALEANLFGPLAVAVLSLRILQVWRDIYINKTTTLKGQTDGRRI